MEDFVGKQVEVLVTSHTMQRIGDRDIAVIKVELKDGTECTAMTDIDCGVDDIVTGWVSQGKKGFAITKEKPQSAAKKTDQQTARETQSATSEESKSILDSIKMFPREQIALMRQTGIIPPHAPDPIIALFLEQAAKYGYNPFNRELYLMEYSRWNKEKRAHEYTHQIVGAIDGIRKKVLQSGEYMGMTMKFDGKPLDEYAPIYMEKRNALMEKYAIDLAGDHSTVRSATAKINRGSIPALIACTIRRRVGSQVVDFERVLFCHEFMADGNPQYDKMPITMLEKVAEMHGLRAAFADCIGNTYIEEEFKRDTVSLPQIGALPEAPKITLDEALDRLRAATSLDELKSMAHLTDDQYLGPDFANALLERTQELKG